MKTTILIWKLKLKVVIYNEEKNEKEKKELNKHRKK